MKMTSLANSAYMATVRKFYDYMTLLGPGYSAQDPEEFQTRNNRVAILAGAFLSAPTDDIAKYFMEKDRLYALYVHYGGRSKNLSPVYVGSKQDDIDVIVHSIVLDIAIRMGKRQQQVAKNIFEFFLEKHCPDKKNQYSAHFTAELSEKKLIFIPDPEPKVEAVT